MDSLTTEATLMASLGCAERGGGGDFEILSVLAGAGRLQHSWELRGLEPTGERLIYQCIIRCERGHQFHSERARSLRVLIFKRRNKKDALMWIKASLIAVYSLQQWLPRLRHRPWLKVCKLAPAAWALISDDRVTASANMEAMTTMPMTVGSTAAVGR